MKRLTTLEPHKIFSSILLAYSVLHCLDIDIQNKDNASPSIGVAGHG